MKRIQQGFTLIELMIVVAIIGILAAIAIPAYSDYTAKSQAAEAYTLLDGLKTPIADAVMQDNSATSCTPPTSAITSGKYVAGITSSWATPICTLTATYKTTGVNSQLAPGGTAATVILTYNSSTGAFTCSGGTLANTVKPKACQ